MSARVTEEVVDARLAELGAQRTGDLFVEKQTTMVPVRWLCCGHVVNAAWGNLRRESTKGCGRCSRSDDRRVKPERVDARLAEFGGERAGELYLKKGQTMVPVRWPCGHVRDIRWNNLQSKGLPRCNECPKVRLDKRIKPERVDARLAELGVERAGDLYVEEKHTWVPVRWPCGHVRDIRWNGLQQTGLPRCNECPDIRPSRRVKPETVDARLAELDAFRVGDLDFKNGRTYVDVRWPCGHVVTILWSNLGASGTKGCAECRGVGPDRRVKPERVDARLAELGGERVGDLYAEKGKTRVSVRWPCGHVDDYTWNSIRNGSDFSCAECALERIDAHLTEVNADRFGVPYRQDGKTHVFVRWACGCVVRVLTANLLHTTNPSRGCSKCGTNQRTAITAVNEEKRLAAFAKAKKVADGEGYEIWLIGLKPRTAQSASGKTHAWIAYKCPEGHANEMQLSNWLSGSRCPDCAEYGFQPGSDGEFYVIMGEVDGYAAAQFGISNVFEQRLKQHKASGFNRVIMRLGPTLGSYVRDLETRVGLARRDAGVITLGDLGYRLKYGGETEAFFLDTKEARDFFEMVVMTAPAWLSECESAAAIP